MIRGQRDHDGDRLRVRQDYSRHPRSAGRSRRRARSCGGAWLYQVDGGGEGAVIIFDLKTNAGSWLSLKALPDTTVLSTTPSANRSWWSRDAGKALMTIRPDIDPKNGKIDEPIPLNGEPEFLTADPGGRAYVNLMTTNEVAAIDLKSERLLPNWPVAPGGAPVGMAIDTTKGHIFHRMPEPARS